MKVLFLYKDPRHARPLLDCRDALRAEGIELTAHHTHNQDQVREVWNTPADLWLVHQNILDEETLGHGPPVTVLERIDGAQLAASRKWIEHPNLRAVIKGYSYRPVELHNRYRGRYHAQLLKQAGVKPITVSEAREGKPTQVSAGALKKIKLGFGFGGYRYLHPFAKVAPIERRIYDTHFAGTVAYSGTEIETHRRLALQAAKTLGRHIAKSGRTIGQSRYISTMRESYTVLSPWGWGEATHRDYEALMLGAVLIKPATAHVDCWPAIYEAGRTYVPCRPDFSDARKLVGQVIKNWHKYAPMRARGRRLVLDARRAEKLAERFAAIWREVLDAA